MRGRTKRWIIGLALAVSLTGAALPAAASARTSSTGGEVGVCVVGVPSPCNGNGWGQSYGYPYKPRIHIYTPANPYP